MTSPYRKHTMTYQCKYKSDPSRTSDEATLFLNNIETQLGNFFKTVCFKNLKYRLLAIDPFRCKALHYCRNLLILLQPPSNIIL